MGRAYYAIVPTVGGRRYAELCGRHENGQPRWRWVSHHGTLTRLEKADAETIRAVEGRRVKIEAARQ